MESFLKDIIDFDGKLNCSSNETHILIVDYKLLKGYSGLTPMI